MVTRWTQEGLSRQNECLRPFGDEDGGERTAADLYTEGYCTALRHLGAALQTSHKIDRKTLFELIDVVSANELPQ